MSLADTTWIAADWGTTNLRVWAMSASGTVLAAATSDDGMGRLTRDAYPAALDRVTADWPRAPVIACGMVGSRQGWAEAAYTAVPCPPLAADLTPAGERCHIISGLKQTDPADVMRGEETQIAGFLALNPGWDGVVCLPGTHTKWVHVSAGEVVSFQTVMTGDLFAAITGHTVLRHTTASGWDDAGFARGVDDAISRPEKLVARLFSLRAEGLLNALPDAVARARLSGLLIGAELAATKAYWLGQQIAVIGAGTLAGLYVSALAAQSAPATQVNADRATLAGLTAAHRRWKDQT